ncbi:uncharacterized protein [Littorina saxatilis]|uniref:uncharacterized protein n=1 Tax=Littorina saxatilis TaxID=31220 RepID=UPI0038B67F24
MAVNNTGCSDAMVKGDTASVVSVRVMCSLTVVLCSWALINLTRYYSRLDIVATLTVGYALLLHVTSAVLSIWGSMLALKSDPSAGQHDLAETVYIWLATFAWQEHMAYFLMTIINVSRRMQDDHIILFVVMSWGPSSSPALGSAAPHYEPGHELECGHSLWRPLVSDLNGLAEMIPTILILAVTGGLAMYEVVDWDKRMRFTHPTCARCVECAKAQRSVRSAKLLRQLVFVFLLASLPRLVHSWLVYNMASPTMRDQEWLWRCSQGMLGALGGVVTLYTQWTLLAWHVIPCFNGSSAGPMTTDGGDHSAVRVVEGGGGEMSQDGQGLAQAERKNWNCQCLHCTEHRRNAEEMAAEKVAALAAEAFAKSCTSLSHKHSSHGWSSHTVAHHRHDRRKRGSEIP